MKLNGAEVFHLQLVIILLKTSIVTGQFHRTIDECLSSVSSPMSLSCRSSAHVLHLHSATVAVRHRGNQAVDCTAATMSTDEVCEQVADAMIEQCQGAVGGCNVDVSELTVPIPDCAAGELTADYIRLNYSCVDVTAVKNICDSEVTSASSGYLGNPGFPDFTPDDTISCSCKVCPLYADNTQLYLKVLGIVNGGADCRQGSFGMGRERLCIYPEGREEDVELSPISVPKLKGIEFRLVQQYTPKSIGQLFVKWNASASISMYCYDFLNITIVPPECPELLPTTTTPMTTTTATGDVTTVLTTGSNKKSLPLGEIFGIVFAVIFVSVLAVLIPFGYCYWKKKKKSEEQEKSEACPEFTNIELSASPRPTSQRRNSASYDVYTVPTPKPASTSNIPDIVVSEPNNETRNKIDEDALVENSQAPSMTQPVTLNHDTDSIDFTMSENHPREPYNTNGNSLVLLGDLQNWASKPVQKRQQSARSFQTDDVEVQSIDTLTFNRSRPCSIYTNMELKSVSSFGDRKSSVASFGTDLDRCDSFSALAKSRSLDNITMCSQDTLGDAHSFESLGDMEDEHFPVGRQGVNGRMDLKSNGTDKITPQENPSQSWTNPAYTAESDESENRGGASSQNTSHSASSGGTMIEVSPLSRSDRAKEPNEQYTDL